MAEHEQARTPAPGTEPERTARDERTAPDEPAPRTEGPAEPRGPEEPSEPAADRDERTEAVEELEDRWRRAVAELDNQRKRHARALERERAAERDRVAAAWLPVLDHLELALSHAESDPSPLVEGVRAIRDQAVQVLRTLGYPRHDETGVPFDPTLHEVVTTVDDPSAAPGTVVGVLRAGYGDPGRQLRPAAVVVSHKQE